MKIKMHSEMCRLIISRPPMFRRIQPSWLIMQIVVITALFFGATAAEAQEAEIRNLGVINSSTSLLLFFDLSHGFSPEVEKGIRNGIPATFNFQVVLSSTQKSQAGEPVVVKEFTRAVHYDSLKEEYRVESSEKENSVIVVTLLAKAKKMMSEVRDFSVVPIKFLLPGEEYIIKVRASLDERTLPMKVHYFLPFWKPWNVETDWYSLTFRFEPMNHE